MSPRSRRAVPIAAAVMAALAGAVAPAGAVCIPAREVFSVGEASRVPFRQPADIVLAGNRLYVLDDLNDRVAILGTAGASIGSVPLPGPPGSSRLGIGFGGADQLFVAASSEGSVVALDLAGRVVRRFPVGAAGAPGRPTGVLVSRSSVIVADGGGHRVQVFALDGREVAGWGGLGEGAEQLRFPWRVAQDSLERVLVTDALNSRVLAFTPRGEPLLSFGEFGVTEGTLFRPAGIAVLEGDRIVVSDGYFGSLQVFEPGGAYAGVLCDPQGRPLTLENPGGLAARGRTVYVVETGGSRVRGYEVGGR